MGETERKDGDDWFLNKSIFEKRQEGLNQTRRSCLHRASLPRIVCTGIVCIFSAKMKLTLAY